MCVNVSEYQNGGLSKIKSSNLEKMERKVYHCTLILESEDGEINDSDSEGLAPKSEEEPSIFPPKKKPDLPPVRENNTHIDREKPLCRYYK